MDQEPKCSAGWYAVGACIALPITALMLVGTGVAVLILGVIALGLAVITAAVCAVAGVLFLVTSPAWVVHFYFVRRRELKEFEASKSVKEVELALSRIYP